MEEVSDVSCEVGVGGLCHEVPQPVASTTPSVRGTWVSSAEGPGECTRTQRREKLRNLVESCLYYLLGRRPITQHFF